MISNNFNDVLFKWLTSFLISKLYLTGARPPVNRAMHQPVTNGAANAQIEDLSAQLLESKVWYEVSKSCILFLENTLRQMLVQPLLVDFLAHNRRFRKRERFLLQQTSWHWGYCARVWESRRGIGSKDAKCFISNRGKYFTVCNNNTSWV